MRDDEDPVVSRLDDVLPTPERAARSIAQVARSLQTMLLRTDRTPGIVTGLPPLDSLIGSGLQPGDTAVIAAATGVGKSLLGFQIAASVARQGLSVLYVSAEMPAEDLAMRFVTAGARVPVSRQRNGNVWSEEWGAVTATLGDLAALPIDILDSGDFTIAEVEREAELTTDLRLICVDYGQMIDSDEKHGVRAEAISAVSRRLKRLAMRLKVVVISMAQVNRAVEGRADKRLLLSDINESGSLARDASLVLMLERDVMGPRAGDATIRVPKNRHGECGSVELRFDTATLTFTQRIP